MIFCLVGTEFFLLHEALGKLLSERVDSASKDFNFDVFEGSDLDIKILSDRVNSLPIFAVRRVVLVRSAHELKKVAMDVMIKILENIPETTDVIFVAQKSDSRTTFWQKLAKLGKIKEFKPLEAREAAQWALEKSQKAGYQLMSDAAQWMVAALGADIGQLHSTIEKLFLMKGAEKKISLADIESCVTAISWKNIFELTDAVGSKKLDRALQLFQRMQLSGESPIAMSALLARHFRILSRVKEGDSGGVPPYFLKDYQRQVGQFDKNKLEAKREKIFQTDWALKSSPLNSQLLFEQLLVELCR